MPSVGSILFCVLLIIFLYLYLRISLMINSEFFLNNVRVVFMGIIILCLRAVVPINFPFTITFPIKRGLPQITSFFLETEIGKWSLVECLVTIWVAGALIALVQLAYQYYRFRILLLQAVTIGHEPPEEIMQILKENNMKKVRVVILSGQIVPAISGVINPILILPDYEYTNEELKFIITHEILHYRKGDLLLKTLLEICVRIYWWNPIVYFFRDKFLLFVEVANDISVIKNIPYNEKKDYVECLYKNAKLCSLYQPIAHKKAFMIPFTLKESDLKIRIFKIINYKRKSGKKSLMAGGINFCVLVIMILSGLFFVPEAYSVSNEVEKTTFTIDENNAYLIKNDNQYDLYVDNTYVVTLSELDENMKRLPIYEEKRK